MATESLTVNQEVAASRPGPDPAPGYLNAIVALLVVLPLLSIALKLSSLPGSELLREALSLSTVPPRMQVRVGYVLFVPLAAVLMVFIRVTLGLRVLGPFRSILLAVAFQVTGIVLGLIFLVITVGTIVGVRPIVQKLRLPYSARVSVGLGTVSVLITLALISSQWLDVYALNRVAYFPIVVLCLTGDGFSRTLRREGIRSAMFRGTTTAAAAVVFTWGASIPGFHETLIRFPELLVLELALIILIPKYLGYRMFNSLNPAPVRERKSRRRATTESNSRRRHQ